MKKRGIILSTSILIFGMLLGGCGMYPDLSEDEEKMVSEYATSLLLKYDKDNHSRLVDTSTFLKTYNDALAERERTLAEYEALKKEKEAQKEAETKKENEIEPETDEKSDDGTGGATVIEKESIDSFLGLDGFVFDFAGCDVVDSYTDATMWTVYPDEKSGEKPQKLLVTYFNIKSLYGGDLDLFGRATYKLSINDESFRNIETTWLDDDMGIFTGAFEAGEIKRLVLIQQIDADINVSSLKLSISSSGKGSATIRLK